MNQIDIFNETEENIPAFDEIMKVIEYAINYQKLKRLEFSIILVETAKIHELNKIYRGVDKPTDVITFALEDGIPMMVSGPTRVLGDIYISVPTAKKQAIEYGHSLTRELCFLAVHGFLHLLGYDHMNEKEEKEMFDLQREILDGYGIKR